MIASMIGLMLATIGAVTLLMLLAYVIVWQVEYQRHLKSTVEECRKALEELRNLLRRQGGS